jgi:hypothetical protein
MGTSGRYRTSCRGSRKRGRDRKPIAQRRARSPMAVLLAEPFSARALGCEEGRQARRGLDLEDEATAAARGARRTRVEISRLS